VPVLVLRDVTERPEGIAAGVARLVGTDEERVFLEADRLLADPQARAAFTSGSNPYGDGRAGERIVDVIAHRLRGSARRVADWTAAPAKQPARRDRSRPPEAALIPPGSGGR